MNVVTHTELDQILSDAVQRRDVPLAVGMVADRERVVWQGSAGMATASRPAGVDTVIRAFSMTKAVGALAAMILVDRGQLTLDTTVASVLPDFADLQVLVTIEGAEPVYRAPSRPVTLRHLLTNTSGLAYEGYNKKQAIWQMITGVGHPITGTWESIRSPLMFDPGEDFAYSHGYDWIGPMIEALDGRAVERFCQEEILDPLGMADTDFERDFAGDRLADLKLRVAGGGFCDFELAPAANPELHGLGQALYTTAADYMQFQRLILGEGELDGRHIVSREAVAAMAANQMGEMSMPIMRSIAPVLTEDVDLFPGVRKTWTAGFMRNETDIPGRRRAGSLTWAGFLNSHYWIDPTAGIAAILLTQSLPFCDERFMATYAAFEQAVYGAQA